MTSANPEMGPYQTEREARMSPAVRAAFDAARAEHMTGGRGALGEHSRQMLLDAVELVGVELGDYDRRTIEWLAGGEPQTCAVIAGLIVRAAGGRANRAGSICGHPGERGGICGLVPGHDERHQPVRVVTGVVGSGGTP